jgi:putative hydrolase of the HAD superfamily
MHPHSKKIQELSQKLSPKPTGLKPKLPKLENIKACIFDIYGTLFMSGCGDISLTEGTNRDKVLKDVLRLHKFNVNAEGLSDRFYSCVHNQQENRRSEGIDFPEVEIRDVWKSFLKEIGIADLSRESIENIAIDYECRVNPIWPMPNLQETLGELKKRGILLGIVSNAQFFTPYLFETFTGQTAAQLGFERDLCIYSYKLHTGKPSLEIYKPLITALKSREIEPSEALFVGNDMRNDIWPAQDMGMRGVLFAGDNRSLRLREEDPRSESQFTDAIVTDLSQLPSLI